MAKAKSQSPSNKTPAKKSATPEKASPKKKASTTKAKKAPTKKNAAPKATKTESKPKKVKAEAETAEPKKVEAEAPKKKRGRPKGSKNTPREDQDPPKPQFHLFEDKIVKQIPLGEIDLENKDFQFRQSLRLAGLADNIKEHGQQIPVVLRPHPKQEGAYQIISGFRRIKAIQDIPTWEHVDAIVREDLKDDKVAFKASLIENEARKTYNDVDRGHAIRRYQAMGHKYTELENIFKLGTRQLKRLKAIPDYPQSLQDALSEEDSSVKMAHAFILYSYFTSDEYEDFDVDEWVAKIQKGKLSTTSLKKAIQETYGEESEVRLFSTEDGADEEGNPIQIHTLYRRKVNPHQLGEAEKASLKRQLQELLDLLG